MYLVMCFILLLSLEGLKAETKNENSTTSTTSPDLKSSTPETSHSSAATTKSDTDTTIHITSNNGCITKQTSEQCNNKCNCLFDIQDKKELKLWGIILVLLLICMLLMVIIMCLACKCCRGNKNDELVIMKSSTSIRRNSVNGGPSKTEVMFQDCSSVKVEIQTTPDESQVPEEVGEAAAENPVNNASETMATQEHLETDVMMEDLKKAE